MHATVAADYQRKLATMAPAPDTESQRMRMHMVEVLCLATVIDNYLEITRYAITCDDFTDTSLLDVG